MHKINFLCKYLAGAYHTNRPWFKNDSFYTTVLKQGSKYP